MAAVERLSVLRLNAVYIFWSFWITEFFWNYLKIQSTLLISNNRLSQSEKLVLLKHEFLTTDKILWKKGEIAPQE